MLAHFLPGGRTLVRARAVRWVGSNAGSLAGRCSFVAGVVCWPPARVGARRVGLPGCLPGTSPPLAALAAKRLVGFTYVTLSSYSLLVVQIVTENCIAL